MTLFGRALGGEEIASLAFLLMALVLWISVWRGERDWTRWFRRWEADRKARREAELAAGQGGDGPQAPGAPRGPAGGADGLRRVAQTTMAAPSTSRARTIRAGVSMGLSRTGVTA